MPQITVEYSAELSGAFDRQAFAVALHRTLSPLVSSDVAAFKTRFRQIEESVIGDGSPGAMIHVRIGLLSGRTAELKQEVGRVSIGLVREHLKPVEGLPTQLTLEVHDMDRDQYQKLVV
ncbi:5-carboxymethyl-2-hydroxymuconate Delta-isomerase [Lentzea nigeriaca]|uniref:5-carboxymethyl-2-hydroxymuconate Delta-isomerase n=1 Tax=Lentzea nigeriaca TaxID=1128665 RepID=UPI00195EA3C2|nr:isomerase [Lentzea nigeriaca]MBM7862284.1 5-carboxymethyl-2-hydroxymuconate isomerase [Lentzea nigeriaca]